ncbi:MAG: helix-turn-helix transcriptional regulator [Berryella intestinalis]|uniref:helix-turn-helix domain-containing protein n=1 Tax=Berryella intestinalis TaxID=1531429 RepID=UPI002A4F7158|nr:helix-turn-helix transcriptional regulator [Berryella intestinalis]MDD7368941.1 helix-turn-helix transcriptional regulator [Berryella intestinalis]MDY3129492.1 helix-turn-helix transcriptional regulator [Berryella intestinalis]
MLSENIRAIRESRGLSQEELAIKLNVVRQTVSKWERGLSVPDSDMLVSMSEALDASVGALLGETVSEPETDNLSAIAEKLQVVDLQLARGRKLWRRLVCGALLASAIAIALVFACLILLGSPYSHWDFSDPELAVAGTLYHGFEWAFVRIAPIVLVAAIAGLFLLRKRE